jgi:hypothetical protein
MAGGRVWRRPDGAIDDRGLRADVAASVADECLWLDGDNVPGHHDAAVRDVHPARQRRLRRALRRHIGNG